MKRLIKLLRLLDEHLLKLTLIGFLFAIPLYPKFPLFDLEYTYISIRADDVFVLILSTVYLIQLIRRKITFNKFLLLPIILFWLAVFSSMLYGFFFLKTIPVFNIGFLHAARRVEYMVVFFIAASSVKSSKDVEHYLKAIFTSLFIVVLYGIGQKFFGLPAVQTMNPEFARGHLLYLTPEARVSSTFAGHYDLAAYLVFLIPLVFGFYYFREKVRYFLLFVLSLFLLVLTASRISFIAYILSVFSLLIFIRKPKMIIIVAALTAIFALTSQNLTSRIFKTLQIKRIFVNEKTGQVVVPERISTKELPAGSFYITLKDQKSKVEEVDPEVLKQRILDEIREQATREGRLLTSSEEAAMVSTVSSQLKPVNTVVSDISFATRLQVEWPRAINAFLKSPIFGYGPSALTESTDNDYLRWIGELGLLGTLLFMYILGMIIFKVWQHFRNLKTKNKYVYIGFLFGVFGLLLNASYIDVFEASKVAYYFWIISGIILSFAL